MLGMFAAMASPIAAQVDEGIGDWNLWQIDATDVFNMNERAERRRRSPSRLERGNGE
jgi:hypothetical protein